MLKANGRNYRAEGGPRLRLAGLIAGCLSNCRKAYFNVLYVQVLEQQLRLRN